MQRGMESAHLLRKNPRPSSHSTNASAESDILLGDDINLRYGILVWSSRHDKQGLLLSHRPTSLWPASGLLSACLATLVKGRFADASHGSRRSHEHECQEQLESRSNSSTIHHQDYHFLCSIELVSVAETPGELASPACNHVQA